MIKPGLAALTLLLCAAPAAAQQPSGARPPPPPASGPADHRLAEPAATYGAPGPMTARFPVSGDLDLGLGMFSVTGAFVRDRGARGREPMIDTAGKQNRIAAIGFSLRF